MEDGVRLILCSLEGKEDDVNAVEDNLVGQFFLVLAVLDRYWRIPRDIMADDDLLASFLLLVAIAVVGMRDVWIVAAEVVMIALPRFLDVWLSVVLAIMEFCE